MSDNIKTYLEAQDDEISRLTKIVENELETTQVKNDIISRKLNKCDKDKAFTKKDIGNRYVVYKYKGNPLYEICICAVSKNEKVVQIGHVNDDQIENKEWYRNDKANIIFSVGTILECLFDEELENE